MIHQIRFQYALNVEAATSMEAYRKAIDLIKQEPAIALRGVGSKAHRPLWKMLLFGA